VDGSVGVTGSVVATQTLFAGINLEVVDALFAKSAPLDWKPPSANTVPLPSTRKTLTSSF
jgi:hypothetical protein